MTIHSSAQTGFGFSHIKGITLGAGEEVDKIAGRTNGMGVDRIGEVVTELVKDRLLFIYRTVFTVESLARVGARNRMWRLGVEVGSDEELTKVRRMGECN